MRLNSLRQALGKPGLLQQPEAKKKPPWLRYFRRFATSGSVSTNSWCPFMNRNGVSYSSGSVNRTLRSSWILMVEARVINCISSCPTPLQSLPSFALYFTRPMKKVACLSSVVWAPAMRAAAVCTRTNRSMGRIELIGLVLLSQPPPLSQHPLTAQTPHHQRQQPAIHAAGLAHWLAMANLFDLGLDLHH